MADWFVRSGATGTGSGADWTNAKTTLALASTAAAAGDRVWVADDHAESTAAAVTITFPGASATSPNFIYCVDHTVASPTVTDLRTTATVSTTGASTLGLKGTFYCYGITFTSGIGTASSSLMSLSDFGATIFDSCKFVLASTNAVNTVANGGGRVVILNNCTVKLSNTAQGISGGSGGGIVWKNSPTPVDITGSMPVSLIVPSGGNLYFEAVDFSALTGTLVSANATARTVVTMKDCKISANALYGTTQGGNRNVELNVIRCDSSGTNYRNERYQAYGSQSTETVIIATGGASDGTTPVSWHLMTNSTLVMWTAPFEALPIATWNDVASGTVNLTLEFLQDPRVSTSLPNNDDIWFDAEYLGASGSPLGSVASGTKTSPLAANAAQTASTKAWDSLAPTRANSTAYVAGNVYKAASNLGRLFFCTTAGTTAGSEPGGISTAVDGGAVTDGTAVFTAAVRFKQTVATSPLQKGLVYAYVKVAKPSIATGIYVDPKITLS